MVVRPECERGHSGDAAAAAASQLALQQQRGRAAPHSPALPCDAGCCCQPWGRRSPLVGEHHMRVRTHKGEGADARRSLAGVRAGEASVLTRQVRWHIGARRPRQVRVAGAQVHERGVRTRTQAGQRRRQARASSRSLSVPRARLLCSILQRHLTRAGATQHRLGRCHFDGVAERRARPMHLQQAQRGFRHACCLQSCGDDAGLRTPVGRGERCAPPVLVRRAPADE